MYNSFPSRPISLLRRTVKPWQCVVSRPLLDIMLMSDFVDVCYLDFLNCKFFFACLGFSIWFGRNVLQQEFQKDFQSWSCKNGLLLRNNSNSSILKIHFGIHFCSECQTGSHLPPVFSLASLCASVFFPFVFFPVCFSVGLSSLSSVWTNSGISWDRHFRDLSHF